MNSVWFYSLLSVFLVSLISFVGIFTLSIKAEKLKSILIYLLAFSAGALLGDTFIHLLPEVVEETGGFGFLTSGMVLGGMVLFFVIEKFIHWQHCHMPIGKEHTHPFAYMNLVGDGIHNFIDGLIIAASFIVSLPVGIATTLAVLLHEIPQEIGDFGVLLHGGFTRGKALALNFLSGIAAILGTLTGLALNGSIENLQFILLPLAAGGFIYIAGADLIPELHKETKMGRSILQLIFFILGIGVMLLLLLLE